MTAQEGALPSERFLAHLHAAVDTDVTLLLRTERRDALAAALRAAAASLVEVGRRARALETLRRELHGIGPYRTSAGERVGPLDLATVEGDPSLLVLRWSHLAGDARTLQELVLDAARAAGFEVGDGCRCVRFGPGRPATAADAWRALRAAGRAHPIDACRAAVPSLAPILRPPGTGRSFEVPPGAEGTDALVAFRLPSGLARAGTSRFAATAAAVAGLAGAGPGARTRIGVTVDLRRHERLPLEASAGNLSLVGWIEVPQGSQAPAAAHYAVQRLLRRRPWRQQLASDAWLAQAPAAVVERLAALVLTRLAARAPVTLTELWRDDGSTCDTCGEPRRRTPRELDVLAIPPAQPPAGLTCGVTRIADELIVVLRRVAGPGRSATAWLEQASQGIPGDRLWSGPISWADDRDRRAGGRPTGSPRHQPPSRPQLLP